MSADRNDKTEARLARLETQVEDAESEIRQIYDRLQRLATKDDLDAVKNFFAERDHIMTDRLWWVVKALVIVFGAVVLAAYGIENLPRILQ